jgi:hypothetical protein
MDQLCNSLPFEHKSRQRLIGICFETVSLHITAQLLSLAESEIQCSRLNLEFRNRQLVNGWYPVL